KVAVGYTVIWNSSGVPSQLFAVGVTVILATMGSLVLLVAVKLLISPSPEAAKPMAVLSLVQRKVVPETLLPAKLMVEVAAPAQTKTAPGGVKVGLGFTVIDPLRDALVQFPVVVTV